MKDSYKTNSVGSGAKNTSYPSDYVENRGENTRPVPSSPPPKPR